jgi:uncharacterized protein (DUF302 family)
MAELKSAATENEISRDRLAELLNEDLSREYQAIIAYVVYSQVLSGAGQVPRLRTTTLAVATSLFLVLVGIGMAIYLISVRDSMHSKSGDISPMNKEALMPAATDNGIISIASNHSVDQTVENLKGILQGKGVALFALIDHSGEAEKVGLKMPPTKLVIFGSPKAGTPLMLAAPSIAIDLPLKILIREDGDGKVWVSYNSPAFLQERHGFPKELLQNITVVEALAAKAGE